MALRTFSAIATSTVLLTSNVTIPQNGVGRVLTLPETANIHFASSVGASNIHEFSSTFFGREELDRIKGEKIWQDLEPLFGLWADNEETDDDWLRNLRSGWDNRLRDLYDFEENN